jgi:hypothetical protein
MLHLVIGSAMLLASQSINAGLRYLAILFDDRRVANPGHSLRVGVSISPPLILALSLVLGTFRSISALRLHRVLTKKPYALQI